MEHLFHHIPVGNAHDTFQKEEQKNKKTKLEKKKTWSLKEMRVYLQKQHSVIKMQIKSMEFTNSCLKTVRDNDADKTKHEMRGLFAPFCL